MSEDRTRHFISDRQLIRALEKGDPNLSAGLKAQMDAVRELLDEAWNKGFSAGQMKERCNSRGCACVSNHSPVL